MDLTLFITSINGALSIIKNISALKTDAEVSSAKVELNNIILTLQSKMSDFQSSYDNIVQSKTKLEQKIMKMKNWNRTKEKYVLYNIAFGSFVYILEESVQSPQTTHWLCTNCFNNEAKESILQIQKKGNIPNHIYYCPQCKNEIIIENQNYKYEPHVNSRRIKNDWNVFDY
ncbi:MAG: hypothetical protein IPH62_00015 [Ignavibacteriae bacterium]|nr:hypothetical protein [Ignavibacteriota bacterium]